jgi:GT2 family glycosyltransferase
VTVDIIIVNWNGGPELLAAIESGNRFGANVIVVDNASTTGVVASLDSRTDIRLIRNPTNTGFGAACNAGALAGVGDFVFLLNPDAEIVTGSATELERSIADSDAMLFGFPIENADSQRVPSGYALPDLGELLIDVLRLNAVRRRLGGTVDRRAAAAGTGWVVGAALAMRRADWERLGGMDDGYFLWYEDVDLGARVAQAGGTVAIAAAPVVRHIGASTWNRLPRRRRQMLRLTAARRYAAKHFGRSGEVAVLLAAPFAMAIGVALDVAHWLARR